MTLQNGRQNSRLGFYVSEDFKEVYRKWKAEGITAVEAMQEAGVKKTSFYKLVGAYEEELRTYICRRNSIRKAFAE